jgi:hypothetical protein
MLRTLATLVLVASISSGLHAQDRADLWRRYAQSLPPQTLVVVVLKNGRSIRGHLVHPSEFALDDVDSIEPQKQTISPGAKVLVGVGSAVGVVFVLFAIALAGSR